MPRYGIPRSNPVSRFFKWVQKLGLAYLAVRHDVDAGLHLLTDDGTDSVRNARIELRLHDALARDAGQHHLAQIGRSNQPAPRRSGALGTAFHRSLPP